MNTNQLIPSLNPLKALVLREIRRFSRIWVQTIIPPVITTSLYFLIFGTLIGERIGNFDGLSYAQFIAPGLILMAVITNSYANTVATFFSAKLQRYIEELIVAPVSTATLLASFILGGLARGITVGTVVFFASSLFIGFKLHDPLLLLTVAVLTSLIFSSLGLINGMFANTFDDTAIVSSFVLTPLTYLGGVFFSIAMLPPFWSQLATINPILYAVNGFRFAMLGISDFSISTVLVVLSSIAIFSLLLCYQLLARKVTTSDR